MTHMVLSEHCKKLIMAHGLIFERLKDCSIP